LFLCAALCTASSAQLHEPIEPIPLESPGDPGRAVLGEALFQDVRLSANRDRACATCHPLDHAGMDGRPRGRAAGDIRYLRNVPTIFNVGFNLFFLWDGKFEALRDLNDRVVQDPAIMGSKWPDLVVALKADPALLRQFASLYADGITRETVLDALENFERSAITPNARFDRYLRGDAGALTAVEVHGYELFKSYGCVACHQGRNVGGNLFQKFGIFPHAVAPQTDGAPIDMGRFSTTHDDLDVGVFRVPSLRNVAVTAPYFHSGSTYRLEEAVATMAQAQLGRSLKPEEVGAVVQFLGTLTGEYRGRPLGPATRPAR
jgi:cytochrome c peroxidase